MTRTIGVVLDVLQNNPFPTQLVDHLQAALHEAAHQVMHSQLHNAGTSSARPLIDGYLAGMVFASATLGSTTVTALRQRGMPIMLVVRSIASEAIDTVEIDNVHAGAVAAGTCTNWVTARSAW